jgi:hypothetical protein
MKTIESLKVVSTRREDDVIMILCTESVALGSGRSKDFHVVQIYRGYEEIFRKSKTYFGSAMEVFNSLKDGKYKDRIQVGAKERARPQP